MPNNTRMPICPYFRDEKNLSISCEDVYRDFDNLKKKYSWMDTYCDTWDWGQCPYAIDLNEMYERIDKGADMEQEQMKHQIEAMSRELKGKSIKLGKANRRLEAKDKEIRELRNKNRILQEQKQEEYSKRRKAEYALDRQGKKVSDQLQEVINLYKDAFCYLLDQHPEKKIPEEDIKAWSKGKSYTVVRMYDDDGSMKWFLHMFEETREDAKTDDGRVSGDAGNEGSEEEVPQHQD